MNRMQLVAAVARDGGTPLKQQTLCAACTFYYRKACRYILTSLETQLLVQGERKGVIIPEELGKRFITLVYSRNRGIKCAVILNSYSVCL